MITGFSPTPFWVPPPTPVATDGTMRIVTDFPPVQTIPLGINPAWWPINPAQQAILQSPAEMLLGGGSSGFGKSEILPADAMQEYYLPTLRGLLLRESLGEMDQLSDRMKVMYEPLGASYRNRSGGGEWEFPIYDERTRKPLRRKGGARIRYGYLAKDSDIGRYRGNPKSWLGIDESGLQPVKRVRTMIPWLASTDKRLRVRARFASNPGGVGACVDEGEVLTPLGWQQIQHMKVGDPVYTVNAMGVMVVSIVQQVHSHWHEGEMIRAKARGLYISCTPNHRVARVGGQRWQSSGAKFSLVPFDDLPGQATILRSVEWKGNPVQSVHLDRCTSRHWGRDKAAHTRELSGTNLCALFGWFLSEGCLFIDDARPGRSRVEISQKKPRTREILRVFLESCGFRPSWTFSGASIYSREWVRYMEAFGFGNCYTKYIPAFVKQGTHADLRAFFDAAMDGDGHWVRKGSSGHYYTTSRQLADDVSEIALKLGYIVHITFRDRGGNYARSYDVAFKTSKSRGTELLTGNHRYKVNTETKRRSEVRREMFSGNVYCIGVPDTHNFIIRQRGSIWVSGNSWQMPVFLRNWCPLHYPPAPGDNNPLRSVVPGKVYSGASWSWPPKPSELVHMTTAFFPATVFDNPLYDQSKIDKLRSQTPEIQMQLLYGCWCNAESLYFGFMNPERQCPRQLVQDAWWMNHVISIDYGFKNSSAAAGLYVTQESGQTFGIDEVIERQMGAVEYAKMIVEKWIKPNLGDHPRRVEFVVMDPATDSHDDVGKSKFELMAEVFAEYGVPSVKAHKDSEDNAQNLYAGVASNMLVLTTGMPHTFNAVSTRVIDERRAILKVHGDPLDDCIDSLLYFWNTFIRESKKPERLKLEESLQKMREAGADATAVARRSLMETRRIEEQERKKNRGLSLRGGRR